MSNSKNISSYVTPVNALASIGAASLLFTAGWLSKVIYQTYIYKCNLTKRFQTKESQRGRACTAMTKRMHSKSSMPTCHSSELTQILRDCSCFLPSFRQMTHGRS
jgi:hypothetical protein